MYVYCIYVLGDKALITHDDRMIGWIVYAELLGHGVVATYYLGIESGFHYYIYILALLPFFTEGYSLLIQILRFFGILVSSFFVNIYLRTNPPILDINQDYIFILGNANLIIFLFIGSALIHLYTLSASKQHNSLMQYSSIDPLTGLYNRRYLSEYIESLFFNRLQRGQIISLLIIDIDNFKLVNDKYGHTFGDIAIQRISSILKDTIEESDVTARWGGDEFVIISISRNKRELTTLVNEIITKTKNTKITLNETSIAITVTCGGAIRKENESFSNLFIRADSALYQGKQSGRNKYVFSQK